IPGTLAYAACYRMTDEPAPPATHHGCTGSPAAATNPAACQAPYCGARHCTHAGTGFWLDLDVAHVQYSARVRNLLALCLTERIDVAGRRLIGATCKCGNPDKRSSCQCQTGTTGTLYLCHDDSEYK